MAGEAPLDELGDLQRHLVGLEARRLGRRWISWPRPAVVGVVAELSAERLAAVHQDPGAPPHLAVEGVHSPRRSPAVGRLLEVLPGRQPALVRDLHQRAGGHEGGEVHPQLALCRAHHPERPELARQRLERRAVGPGGDHVTDRDPAAGLLEREVAQVGEHQGQLLAVVGPPGRLPRVLHDDDAELAWFLDGERADAVRQLVVRHIEPAPAARIGLPVGQRAREVACGHRPTLQSLDSRDHPSLRRRSLAQHRATWNAERLPSAGSGMIG